MERLRDPGFTVCATEKLTDVVDFLDDAREAAMRVISSGTIAKAKIRMAEASNHEELRRMSPPATSLASQPDACQSARDSIEPCRAEPTYTPALEALQ